MIYFRHFAPALLVGLGLLTGAAPSPAQSPAPSPGHGLDLSSIDPSVAPCENFYQFANGKWLDTHPVPADRTSYGGFTEASDRSQLILRQIAEQSAQNTGAKPGSVEAKVGRFYKSGMDEARIAADGATPLAPEFARIAAVQDLPGLQEEIAHLHREGIGAAWGFGVGPDAKASTHEIAQVSQGGLGLPDRDYYLNQDDKTKAIRDGYTAHVAKMLTLLGDAPAQASAEASTILAMETRLAQASLSRVERRNPNASYHRMPVSGLDALTPGVSWAGYFKAVGLPDPGSLNVGQPQFFVEVGKMLTGNSLDDWKAYLRWHLIHGTASTLSPDFENENFRFYGTTLSGAQEQQPRWKRVLGVVDGAMGEGLGQLYVEKAFSPQAKARALALVKNLQSALHDRIQTLDWMGPDTKKQAIAKLSALTIKIGYPDKWRDYSKLKVDSPSYVLNVMVAREFEYQRELSKFGKPVDKSEWGMSPPTINAYYSPTFNEIVFPAGILQPPFFNPDADDAVNYGGIGMVIGHEMTHGFDDQGRQFDAQGNLRDWWTPADAKNFSERAAQLAAQYDAYTPVDNSHINGRLTLGENIADLGGLKIAYLAYEKSLQGKPHPAPLDGYTAEQRFFLGFAQAWHETVRPEALRLALVVDPHSPARYRVLGPLSDMAEFAQAFHCPETTTTAKRVTIW